MPQKTLTHQNEDACFYNTKIKIFPHQIKITCFSRAVFNPDGIPRPKQTIKENREELEALWLERVRHVGQLQYAVAYENSQREHNLKEEKKRIRRDNMKRAKDRSIEIAYANGWEYFITFTLDAKNINRYDKTEVLRCFKKWLDNMTQRRNLRYLIFPEFHKDGAIHFHGLCSGKLELVFSGKYTQSGQAIYNCLNWSLGFTSVVILGGPKERIVNYVMKYITKANERVFGNAYFAGGKGLVRELPTQYENLSFSDIDAKIYSIPDAGMCVKYQTIQREDCDNVL